MVRGALAGYGPWGHKELDMTEFSTVIQNLFPRFYLISIHHKDTILNWAF